LVIYSRPLFYKSPAYSNQKNPVSVIICARNEEENLKKNLPFILEQDYPAFEVIVVNDRSTDGTGDVLADLEKKYPVLKTTAIKLDHKFKHGKKLALTLGIKAASNEWLLLTDADCKPVSNQWISCMQRNFKKDKSIILGYGGYYTRKGLLNLLIRWDTVNIALQYFSLAMIGRPYMGTGRNLAYRKSLFFEKKGFASHSHIISGDDDLFINEAANKKNTGIEFHYDSYTRSEAKSSLRDWFYQKKRHLTTGPHYKTSTKLILGLETSSRILLYISFIFLLINNIWPVWFISAFLFRLIIIMMFFKIISSRLCDKYLLLPSSILDLLLPLFNIFVHFTNYVAARRSRWN